MDANKLKNKLKKDKKKEKKKNGINSTSNISNSNSHNNDEDSDDDNNAFDNTSYDMMVKNESKNDDSRGGSMRSRVEIEYVSQDMNSILDASIDDPDLRAQFKDIFSKFAKLEDLVNKPSSSSLGEEKSNNNAMDESGNDAAGAAVDSDASQLSNKKKKLTSRLSVAELKTLVPRPDVVEAHDVTSSNPRLLVYLKSYRNSVPVPRHWCAKRKYLQGKRGVEKPPFKLPEFIADTGISKIRDSLLEREALKNSKQKARDRLQVKNGKLDIDYQVLHDAFFKFQTMPKLSLHGDIYYEGKEFEKVGREFVPGVLSDALKEALGIVDGQPTPPPWLTNMQRYGPPPSYPSLKIPGLNAPLPPDAVFGFHAGGWGKPPVDEYGQPLYGDVFGVNVAAFDELAAYSSQSSSVLVDKKAMFGKMNEIIIESESDDEGAEEEGDEDAPTIISKKYNGSNDLSGLETPSTISGLETPNVIDIRKRLGTETPEPFVSKDLYTVLAEKTISGAAAGQFFKSDRSYVIPGMEGKSSMIGDRDGAGDVVDVVGGGDGGGFDSQVAKGKGASEGETQKRKRHDDSSSSKKLKDFKF